MPKITKWIPTVNLQILRRMGKTVEECNELSIVAARCIIQGIDEFEPGTAKTNRWRLIEESADVLAQIECNIEMLGLEKDVIEARKLVKIDLMKEWEAMFGIKEKT